MLSAADHDQPPSVLPLADTEARPKDGFMFSRSSVTCDQFPLSASTFATTLATWPDSPGMFSVAPSTISMRTTLSAVMRPSDAAASFDLPDTRRPLISTFWRACPKPRSLLLDVISKPGMLATMSIAVFGAKRAK